MFILRFIFIEFENEAEAQTMMEENQGSELYGEELKLAYAAMEPGNAAAKPQSEGTLILN